MITTTDEREGLPSASNSPLWNCAGQRNLMEACGNPKSESTADSTRGDRIHAAFETGNTLMLDEEQAETYQQGVKFMDMLLDSWTKQNDLAAYIEGPREERMWFRDEALTPLASAKLDRHYLSGIHGLVVDLKSGWVPNLIPSPRSTQLRLQMACLKDEYPELEHIRVAFAKAKLTHGYNDYCDYGPDDIKHAQEWVRQHLWQIRQPDAPRTPGRHCDYCPVQGWCVEAGAYSLMPSVIADQSMRLPIIDPVMAVSQMTLDDLFKIWQSSGLITKIMTAVKNRLKALPDSELAMLGIRKAKGRDNYAVVDIEAAIAILGDGNAGWSSQTIYSCMEFSNTKLAEEARRQIGFTNDEHATKWVREKLASTMIKTTSEAPLKEL